MIIYPLPPHTKSGFSLVELSIVLVILGLLTGGILAGQSLIRAAELRSIIRDADKYQVAITSFRDKYFALPGDMTNATAFWGTDPDGCPAHTNRVAKIATCNGNGNGAVGPTGVSGITPAANEEAERPRAWQQLANAGLVEGSYTGVSGANVSTNDLTPGENIPAGRISGTGYSFVYAGNPSGMTNYYDASYGNAFVYGTAIATDFTYGAAIKPEEAWNIDSKIDDSKPAYGRVMAFKPALISNCSSNATASSADYMLTHTGASCSLILKTGL